RQTPRPPGSHSAEGQPGHRHTFNPRIPPGDGRDAQLIREAARASLAEGDPSMNTQAKRLYLLLALIPLLFLAAACGGGSAPLPPPPPPAKFSNEIGRASCRERV